MRNYMTAAVSFALVAVMLFGQTTAVRADGNVQTSAAPGTVQSDDYASYLKQSPTTAPGTETITVAPAQGIAAGADLSRDGSALVWKNGSGAVDFRFTAAREGQYRLKIVWKPLTSGLDVSLGMKLDGAYPFAQAQKIVMSRIWKNASPEPRTDDLGNEYAQEQVEVDEAILEILHDQTGAVAGPYLFCLSAGEHLLTLEAPMQGLRIEEISFIPPEQTASYKETVNEEHFAALQAEPIVIPAEGASRKTDPSIIPKSNNSDAGMTPCDPKRMKINYIGGTAWEKPAQWLSWDFEVPQTGYYSFSCRYKQSDLINGQSVRWLKIDGETPFSEAKNLVFPYGIGWENYVFSDDANQPYYFYLEQGSHTLSLEVAVGEKSDYFRRLSGIVETLGDEYIQIVMITGETPDVNRDYELFRQIPGFTETLENCRDELNALVADINAVSGNHETQYAAAMKNTVRVLEQMLKSPYIAQQYLSDYYSNYTALGAWLYDMVNMPLSLDEIRLTPYGQHPAKKNAGFFRSLWFGARRFFISFSGDYAFSAVEKKEGSVRIWVNWGQDQASVLNSLIRESFTSQTGIDVRMEIVNASLINGMLAGNFPDLALQMSRTDPVNYGIRGALYDLRSFADCGEVLQRFRPSAEVPYEYNGALYALPDTQSFFLMFCRTDIFERLGLTVPKTWEEFLEVATVLQRNNMSVYMPYTQITSSTTVNAGIGSLNLFPTLMSQSGLNLYNEQRNGSDLLNKAAINVFDRWTEFYTDYDFYKEADFYNRFRGGAIPLGIAPYSMYMTLYSAAREINGRWEVALVPGTEGGNNTVAGAGTGCAIIKKSPNKKESWEFLKWWTDADTQKRYSRNVESLLGMIGRIPTSNVEAFSELSWEADALDVMMEEWSLVKEVPEVPGSYYFSRCVDQAYWSVVNGTSRSKDALTKWCRVADEEIARKISEYG